MEIIIRGIITGLLLSIMVGGTFFMLIETSITRGFKAALWFDAGVLLCDATLITLVYFCTSWINNYIINNTYFNIAGGTVFMGFGVSYIFARRRNDIPSSAMGSIIKSFLNGFFVNLLNPGVVIFWLGTMAITLSSFRLNGRQTLLYFGTILLVVALTDIVKAFFACRLSRLINVAFLRKVYVISGIIMIGLGIYFILK